MHSQIVISFAPGPYGLQTLFNFRVDVRQPLFGLFERELVRHCRQLRVQFGNFLLQSRRLRRQFGDPFVHAFQFGVVGDGELALVREVDLRVEEEIKTSPANVIVTTH